MSRGAGHLFPAALGVSAAAHLLVLFLLPYSPARPAGQPTEPFLVRLLETPRPAPPPFAAHSRQVSRPEPAPAEAPPPILQSEPPPVSESPVELEPPEPAAAVAPEQAARPQPGAAGSPAPSSAGASSARTAEVAAIQAMLASLRARVVEKISYPPLARARDWRGTVLLAVVLDGQGRLRSLEVRRSSGYAVLDRAAAALLKGVTPVPNPLGRPLAFDFPIEYALED